MRERGRGGAKLHNQVFYYYVIIQNGFNISVYERERGRERRERRGERRGKRERERDYL